MWNVPPIRRRPPVRRPRPTADSVGAVRVPDFLQAAIDWLRHNLPRVDRRIGAGLAAAAAIGLVAWALISGPLASDDEPEVETKVVTVEIETDDAGDAPVGPLGFPLVATRNTTRVGGPDPASDAAAIALATHPPSSARRPRGGGGAGRGRLGVLGDRGVGAGGAAASRPAARRRRRRAAGADRRRAREAQPARGCRARRCGRLPGRRRRRALRLRLAEGRRRVPRGDRRQGRRAARRAVRRRARTHRHREQRRARLRDACCGLGRAVGRPGALQRPRRGPRGRPSMRSSATAAPPSTCSAPRASSPSEAVREIERISPGVQRVGAEGRVANAIAFARYADQDFGWNINDPGHGLVIASTSRPLDAAAAATLSASGKWGPLLLLETPATLPPELSDFLLDIKPGFSDGPDPRRLQPRLADRRQRRGRRAGAGRGRRARGARADHGRRRRKWRWRRDPGRRPALGARGRAGRSTPIR